MPLCDTCLTEIVTGGAKQKQTHAGHSILATDDAVKVVLQEVEEKLAQVSQGRATDARRTLHPHH